MSIKRIKDFDDGSGDLSNDDIFLFMDSPAGSGITKKISLADLSAAIGGGSVPDGNFDVINLSTTADPEILQGSMGWNITEGTVSIGLTDQVKINIGEHTFFRIRNNTGGTFYAGQTVQAAGVHNNIRIDADKFISDGSVREIRLLGCVLEDIAKNQSGYAINFGYIQEIDTRGNGPVNGTGNLWDINEPAWVEGDILFAHPTIPGKLTKIEPKHSISVALVIYVHQNHGRIFIRPTSYGHLNDNHDVNISSPADGQILKYNSSTTQWENTNIITSFVKYDYATDSLNISGSEQILGIDSDGGSFTPSYDGGLNSDISIDNTTGIISGFVENGIYRFDGSFFYYRSGSGADTDNLTIEYKSGSSTYNTLDQYFMGESSNNFTAKLNGVMKFTGSDPTQRTIRISQNPNISSDLYVKNGYFTITRIA